jgi:hypothetical protein
LSTLKLLSRRQLLALPLATPLLPNLALAQNTGRIDYEAVFGGAKLADVTVSYTESAGQYQIGMRFDPQIGRDRRYESRGLVTREGLRPQVFRILEEGKTSPRRVVDFDWAKGEVRHGAEVVTRSPLLAGTQDILSLPFHLARWRPTGEANVAVSRGDEPQVHRVSPRGTGRFSLPSGPRAVERYRVQQEGNAMEVWLLADEPRWPVQTGLATALGTVVLQALRVG